MSKNIIPILTLFFISLLTFIALQIISIVTNQALPTATQKQIAPINPSLNPKVLEDLKSSPQFN